jgi:hypothetical protein
VIIQIVIIIQIIVFQTIQIIIQTIIIQTIIIQIKIIQTKTIQIKIQIVIIQIMIIQIIIQTIIQFLKIKYQIPGYIRILEKESIYQKEKEKKLVMKIIPSKKYTKLRYLFKFLLIVLKKLLILIQMKLNHKIH